MHLESGISLDDFLNHFLSVTKVQAAKLSEIADFFLISTNSEKLYMSTA